MSGRSCEKCGTTLVKCPDCNGEGKHLGERKCVRCNGTGHLCHVHEGQWRKK